MKLEGLRGTHRRQEGREIVRWLSGGITPKLASGTPRAGAQISLVKSEFCIIFLQASTCTAKNLTVITGTFLVVQRLRICLPMQGVQSLIMELRFPHAAGRLSLCAATKAQHRQNKNKKKYKKNF